jgi:HAD superfamily hydrolase (TIGR01459 family)
VSAPLAISGLSAILDRFDAFLIDQFGVLRDGSGPYPQAAATLAALKAAGKRNIILSNSGKRSEENSARLAALGFARDSWDWFLTSGETAFRIMAGETGHAGRKCLLISRDGDLSPLDGLDIIRTDAAGEADIVLIAASEGDVHPLDHYAELLRPAALRATPCLCTNPDKVMLTKTGTAFGAGRIAELYADMGGPVRWIGKPFPDIYAEAQKFLGAIAPERICAIGDSIEHDIAGAAQAGLASVLVTTGILADATDADRARLYAEHGAVPDFVLPSFRM